MYNKKVLIESLKKLGSAKAPTQKKDVVVGLNNPIQMSSMKQGGSSVDKQLSVKKSNIQGNGLFINEPIRKGDIIGLAHINNQATPIVGKNHNHSENNPTAVNISQGNKRYLVASKDLPAGTEITTNYRLQPELEQPEDFMRNGGMTPTFKKGGVHKTKNKNSRSYSRSFDATNKFFAENYLFEKPSSRKNKIYDPHAKYYQKGGASSPEAWGQEIKDLESQIGNPDSWTLEDYYLLQDKLNDYRNWRETTPEGQAVNDSHNEEGEYNIPLPEHLRNYTNAVMKSKLAYANEFGNPAAKRMINLSDNPYQFDNGDTGTHYMASMDNYAVPQIQDENGQLMLGDYGPESDEAIRFDSDEDANYFAEHYKDVAPGFINAKLSPEEIQEYAKGGYIIEDISVPELDKAQKGKTVQPVKFVPKPKPKPADKKILDKNGNTPTADYLKKYPPIYVSDPKDVRIGLYSEAGNIYVYKPKPVINNIYQEPINKPNVSIYKDKENKITNSDVVPKGYERAGRLFNAKLDPKTFKTIKQWEDGGEMEYELGDTVDKATMERLRELGYTFETI
jgi:hypothetical protein